MNTRKVRIISIIAIVVGLGACIFGLLSDHNGGRDQKAKAPAPKSYKLPVVPMSISDPQDAQEYVLKHCWDQLLSVGSETSAQNGEPLQRDSTHIDGYSVDDIEKAYGMYATLLEMQPLTKSREIIMQMFDNIERRELSDSASNAFEYLTHLTTKYLYDPNSPVRDEDIYQPFAQALSVSTAIPESMHAAYAYDARVSALNQVGTTAADFSIMTLDGRHYRLYDIHAERILLFFSNPGCNMCREIQDELTGSEQISHMVSEGRLKVVNVYIDEELDKWREYAVNYPDSWISGYNDDSQVRGDLIYNVRAIPSLYLLDSDHRVILKDAPIEKVLNYLSSQQ